MSWYIVYTNANDEFELFMPAPSISVDQALSCCPANSLVKSLNELPSGAWDFMPAWEIVNSEVVVSMQKAKELTKRRLREERQPLFTQYDIAFQRALETGASTTAIVAEKQRLRDITLLPDSCSTLNELRSLKCTP